MSVSYTWTFPILTAYSQYEEQTNVVYTVHWVLTGTDGTYTGSVYGTVGLTYVAGSPYTPYNQLIEDQVKGWTLTALGAQQVAQLEATIDAQIQHQIAPTSVDLSPPWSA